jgi:flagellin-specific chaperone FliS
MNGVEIYRQQRALGWTRVDLLLALYSSAIRDIDDALTAIDKNDTEASQQKRNHAMRVVLQLQTGLDFDYGELPLNVFRLCEFVQHALLTGEKERLASARGVLATLHDAFETIRAEAVELEGRGDVPPVELVDTQGLMA